MEKQQEKKPGVEFDAVFDTISTFGWYQRVLYSCAVLAKLPMSAQFGFLIFSFGTPPFQCTTLNITCPIKKCCENCTSYEFKGAFFSTVTEWNLICDRAYITAIIQSSFFGGMLVGSALGGIFSDAFGRKKCVFFNCVIMASVSLGSAFADSFILSSVLRFVAGVSHASLMITVYTYSVEIVGPKKRTMASNVNGIFWVLGGLTFLIITYLLPYWRHNVIAGSLLGFVFLFFYKVLPESPRWLVAHGHLVEAHAVLMKYGSKNKIPIDEEKLMTLLQDIREKQLERFQQAKKYHILDMFKTPRLRRWSCLVCFNWFVISLVFFALMLFVSQLTGNVYMNATIMYLVNIPSTLLNWAAVVKFGRRLPFFTLNCLAAAMSFSFPFIPREYALVTTALALMGRALVGANFTNIYLITSELYPTVIRNIAIGIGSMSARCGAILAPYVIMMAQLPRMSITYPMFIFGGLAIAGATTVLFLPETLFSNMHQTIEETEEAVLDYGVPCCGKPTRRAVNAPLAEKEPLATNDEHEMVDAVSTV